MDFLLVISLVNNVEVGFSGSVRLFQVFFSMNNIMDRPLIDLQAGNNLLGSINGE